MKEVLMKHQAHGRRIAAVFVAGVIPLVAVGSASSAASSRVGTAAPTLPVVELLSRGTVTNPVEAEARGIELETERPIDVVTAHLTFEPGSSIGWHTHPGPTVVTVIAGSLTTVQRDCTSETYETGDTFIEEGPQRHLARNAGSSTAETIVTFFVPVGADPLSIPASAPSSC
jgi:quercetin dioxygenase-like cupin family protein